MDRMATVIMQCSLQERLLTSRQSTIQAIMQVTWPWVLTEPHTQCLHKFFWITLELAGSSRRYLDRFLQARCPAYHITNNAKEPKGTESFNHRKSPTGLNSSWSTNWFFANLSTTVDKLYQFYQIWDANVHPLQDTLHFVNVNRFRGGVQNLGSPIDFSIGF